MPKLIISIVSSIVFIAGTAHIISWVHKTLDAAAKNDTSLLAPNVPTSFH